MYQVKIQHHKPTWERGDLIDETALVNTKEFATKRGGKNYIESKVASGNYTEVQRNYNSGSAPSVVIAYTGQTWKNERTNEEHKECYIFTLNKA